MNIENLVLLVDDDPDDREMLQSVLNEIDITHHFVEADNGVEALSKLDELFENGKLPCLVVLDINMPKMDGKQTFLAFKNDERFSNIPVVVFSTSDSMLDKKFFQRHNTAYFVKPINFTKLKETAANLITICQHYGKRAK